MKLMNFWFERDKYKFIITRNLLRFLFYKRKRNLLDMDDWYGIRAKALSDDPTNNRIIKVTNQTKR